MILEHFLAMLPLFALLIMSVKWYGKAIMHLMTIAYSVILAYIAIVNTWELLFFPVCLGSVVIGIILSWYAFTRGDWL